MFHIGFNFKMYSKSVLYNRYYSFDFKIDIQFVKTAFICNNSLQPWQSIPTAIIDIYSAVATINQLLFCNTENAILCHLINNK